MINLMEKQPMANLQLALIWYILVLLHIPSDIDVELWLWFSK
jgi:hypothetical protein